jgi:hypothetical protein
MFYVRVAETKHASETIKDEDETSWRVELEIGDRLAGDVSGSIPDLLAVRLHRPQQRRTW